MQGPIQVSTHKLFHMLKLMLSLLVKCAAIKITDLILGAANVGFTSLLCHQVFVVGGITPYKHYS